jgi:hypothetical protein
MSFVQAIQVEAVRRFLARSPRWCCLARTVDMHRLAAVGPLPLEEASLAERGQMIAWASHAQDKLPPFAQRWAERVMP